MSDRLDGIDQILKYMNVGRTEFYRDHAKAIRPYLLTRDNAHRRKAKHRIYSFKDLIRAYLIDLEIKKHSD